MEGWSLSFEAAFGAPQDPAAQAEPVIFACRREWPLPNQRVLLGGLRGERRVVTADVAWLLRACRRFDTLQGHLRHLEQSFPEMRGHANDLRRLLQGLSEGGFLVSPQGLLAAAATHPAEPPPRPQALEICIGVCNRPRILKRLLESLPRESFPHRVGRVWIIDDSPTRATHQAYATVVQAWAKSVPEVQAEFVDLTKQQGLIDRLIDRFPNDEASIRFLLEKRGPEEPPTYGRTRNIGLLLTAGRRLLFVDEDVVFNPRRPPGAAPGRKVGFSRRDAAFFSSHQEWADWEAASPLQALDEVTTNLGARLGSLISAHADATPDPLDFVDLDLGEAYFLNNQSRVLLAGFGCLGDVGIAQNQWLFTLEAASRERLLQSEAFYAATKQAGVAWLGRNRAALVNRFAILNQVLALDNRALLPPFFPFFRNEDRLFGECLRFLHPGALMYESNLAMPHLPDGQRDWASDLAKPMRFGFLSLTVSQVAQQALLEAERSPSQRLRSLARLFSRLSRLDDQEVRGLVEDFTTESKVKRIERWFGELSGEVALASRKADLLTLIETNESSLANESGSRLLDLDPYAVDHDGYLRHLWGQYGAAIGIWEELVAYCASPEFTETD